MLPSLSELAEDAGAYLRPAPGDIRLVLADVVLNRRSTAASFQGNEASRLRLPADPRGRMAEIREWFRTQGATRWMWILGPSSTPADLEDQLRAGHDVERAEEDGHRALLLDREPPRGPDRAEVQEVLTYEAFCRLDEVQSLAFAESEAARKAMIASRQERWDALQASGEVALLCFLDGEAVAGATMAPLEHGAWFLLGGATIPEARGRGLYRALVHARWKAAMARGGSALAVHAGPMSAPILRGMGFADVGRIDLLLERDALDVPDGHG